VTRLDDIEARVAAVAASLPWIKDPDDPAIVLHPDDSSGFDGTVVARVQRDDYGLVEEDVTDLIAHAPADLVALVKVVREVTPLHQPRTVYANETHCSRLHDADHAMGRHVEDRTGSWVCLDYELASECITCCDTGGATAEWPCSTAQALSEMEGS